MREKLTCILLVEDNYLTNIYNKKVLDQMNVVEKILIAENGQEALDYIFGPAPVRPELIFLDINMPRMNRWEFLEEYRKMKTSDYDPVIVMLTSSQNPDDSKLANSYSEIRYFTRKPILRVAIEEILDKYF